MVFERVACIGAGLIGHSWAALFAIKGFKVKLYDIGAEQLESAKRRIEGSLNFLERKGLLEERVGEEALSRIEFTTDLVEAVEDVDYVQESIYERYDAKKAVFRELDAHTPEDVILASSTSGLLMTEIQKVTEKPERCVIAHPWNPPLLIPLVEIVPGEKTAQSTVDTTYELMLKLGKVPVVLKREVPGFIGNRLQAALWREAISLVDRGVASVEDVDKALRAGPGIRWGLMGPHMTLHLGGGKGGIESFITHLGPTYSTIWRDMDCWVKIPKSAAEKVIKGVDEMMKASGKSMEEIANWRDEKLVEILKIIYGEIF